MHCHKGLSAVAEFVRLLSFKQNVSMWIGMAVMQYSKSFLSHGTAGGPCSALCPSGRAVSAARVRACPIVGSVLPSDRTSLASRSHE